MNSRVEIGKGELDGRGEIVEVQLDGCELGSVTATTKRVQWEESVVEIGQYNGVAAEEAVFLDVGLWVYAVWAGFDISLHRPCRF